MALDLNALSSKEAVTAIFIGYYDRAPAPTGLNYWAGEIDAGRATLAQTATAFAVVPESQANYPALGVSGSTDLAGNVAFVTAVFQNLFGRDPNNIDTNGGADNFWVAQLEGGADIGQLILDIMSGAQGDDLAILENKIEVGVAYAAASEAEGTLTRDDAGDTILDGVDGTDASVAAALVAVEAKFPAPVVVEPTVPGEEYFLTSGTDAGADFTGTENDDTFNAYIAQNPFAGGVSNTLSSADRLDGGAGNDRLYAEVTGEFVGVVGNAINIDIQPRLSGIEEIDIEARESNFGGQIDNFEEQIAVDAKNIVDHVEIGSYFSDGNLKIENVTTLTSGGSARNTSEITVKMDHTDNFNTDGDASDLTVLFDNDYLLSGQESEGKVFYFLLDEDAELAGLDDRLDNIDVDGIRFNITNADGSLKAVVIEAPEANTAGTHQGFVNALQPALQALIADGTLPAGTTLTLDPTLTDVTFIDDGSQSAPIPAIVVTTGDGSAVTATGFSRIEDEIGEYDVYGRFDQVNETADQPISVDVELHKAGRGGEGGDLIVGGKSIYTDEDSIADGIEVINIAVEGRGDNDSTGATKPSNVGTITSTGNELKVVNITTAPEFVSGTTHASLTVRNGFDENTFGNTESGDLQMINADGFLGDLTLGDIDANQNSGRITNADTITAQGGGDVTLGLNYNGSETAQAYSVTTGSGADDIDVTLDGDAVDYANSSLNISTNGGDDSVKINFNSLNDFGENHLLNQTILNNVTVDTGEGNDMVDVDNVGGANINTRAGNDVIYTDGGEFNQKEIWAFNYDDLRAPSQAVLGGFAPEDLPGEATSLAFLDNAVVTVTLSGAGIAGTYAAGGGLMSVGAAGAVALDDGYESSSTITTLINGNEHFGDQRDVNAAVLDAINNDPVLGNLLTASIGANNTLVVVSNTSGAFDATDLRIEINGETYTSAAYGASVLAEARSVFSDSAISMTDLFGAAAPAAADGYVGGAAGYGADLTTSVLADAWYDGLSAAGDAANSAADNTHTDGFASTAESDNTIDAGEGDDLIVLSTDGSGTALPIAPTTFTKSAANSLINDASNETIVLTGNSFGNDTVMNFTALESEAGLDFLDFTAYLTSQTDVSPGTAGTGSDSFVDTVVTTDIDLDDVAANEVAIVDFTAAAGELFAGLGAAQVTALFNNTDGSGDWGKLSDAASDVVFAQSSTAVVGGAGKAVIMIQNTANDGDYKVFELTWDAGSATAPSVAVAELGSLDFGDTLDNVGDTFLVGTAAYDALFA